MNFMLSSCFQRRNCVHLVESKSLRKYNTFNSLSPRSQFLMAYSVQSSNYSRYSSKRYSHMSTKFSPEFVEQSNKTSNSVVTPSKLSEFKVDTADFENILKFIKERDLANVKKMFESIQLNKHRSLLTRKHNNKTCFETACTNDHIEIALFLLAKEFSFNEDSSDILETIIVLENINSYVKIKLMDVILQRNKHFIVSQNKNNMTPLLIACSAPSPCIELVTYLIEKGSDIDAVNSCGDTPLIISCRNNSLDIVEFLLSKDADIFACNSDGLTSLMAACEKGRARVVEYLINFGVSLDVKNKLGNTALMLACAIGSFKIAELLINAGADIHARNDEGLNALSHSVLSNQNSIVDLLLKNDADINAKNNEGYTPLILACKYSTLNMVEHLVFHEADIDSKTKYNATALYMACSFGRVDVVNFLLKTGVDVDSRDVYGVTPLILASRNGNLEIVKILLEHGADSNIKDYSGNTALMTASMSGHIDIVSLLQSNGANNNDKGKSGLSAFMYACRSGHLEVAAHLIHPSIINSTSVDNYTSLILACKNGYYDIVKLLVENNCDMEMKGNDGKTALMVACEYGHLKIAQYLLQNNAKINATTKHSLTPFFYACYGNHTDIIKLLLQHGAIVNLKVSKSKSALHYLCQHGNDTAIELLFDANINLDINILTSQTHQTPLMIATKYGHKKVVSLLLSKGAKPDIINSAGRTALFVACGYSSSPNLEIMELLIKYTSNLNFRENNNNSILHILSRKDENAGIIEKVLKRGAYHSIKNKIGWTPLMVACFHGQMKIITLLVQYGAIDKISYNRRHSALTLFLGRRNNSKKFNEIIELLVPKNSVEIDTTKSDTLFDACKANDITRVQSKLNEGHSIESKSDEGWSALHYACSIHSEALVEYLCSRGANIELKTNDDITPLMMACESNSINLISSLISRGADLEAVDKSNHTALMRVFLKDGNMKVLEYLLNEGANINTKDSNGNTLLHFACLSNSIPRVKFLLERSAMVNIKNNDSKYPLNLVSNNKELESLLIKYGSIVTETNDASANNDIDKLKQNMMPNANPSSFIQDVKDKTTMKESLQNQSKNSNVVHKQTDIYIASSVGNFNLVKLLLDRGADVDFKSDTGETSLMVALRKRLHQISTHLINKGANIEAVNSNGQTAFLICISENKLSEAALLLDHGANINAVDNNGDSALHIACGKLTVHTVQFLLKRGIDLNLKNNNGNSALMTLQSSNHNNGVNKKLISILIEHGAQTSESDSNTGLSITDNKPNMMINENTIELNQSAKDATNNNENKSRLMKAVQRGNINHVRSILRKNVDINISACNEALLYACSLGNIKLVELFLSRGADIHSKSESGETLLMIAAREANRDMMNYLIQNGANIDDKNSSGLTAFMIECIQGENYEIAKFLLEKGANINAVENHGNTALHLACSLGDYSTVKFLLENGADKNIANSNTTALMIAYAGNYSDIIKLLEMNIASTSDHQTINSVSASSQNLPILLEKEKSINVTPNQNIQDCNPVKSIPQDISPTERNHVELTCNIFDQIANLKYMASDGWTAIHFACALGNIDAVMHYIDQGSSVNVMNSKGVTPLMLACENGFWNIIILLVKNGADVESKDMSGRTIFMIECSKYSYNHEILEYLIVNGASINATDSLGNTSLISACSVGHFPTVKFLLDKGANMNIRNRDHQSALRMACLKGHADIVYLLLAYHVNANDVDVNGDSTLELVQENQESIENASLIIQMLHNRVN